MAYAVIRLADWGSPGYAGDTIGIDNLTFQHTVPEPSTLCLLALALVVWVWRLPRR